MRKMDQKNHEKMLKNDLKNCKNSWKIIENWIKS